MGYSNSNCILKFIMQSLKSTLEHQKISDSLSAYKAIYPLSTNLTAPVKPQRFNVYPAHGHYLHL